jgi:hypothetical protein
MSQVRAESDFGGVFDFWICGTLGPFFGPATFEPCFGSQRLLNHVLVRSDRSVLIRSREPHGPFLFDGQKRKTLLYSKVRPSVTHSGGAAGELMWDKLEQKGHASKQSASDVWMV